MEQNERELDGSVSWIPTQLTVRKPSDPNDLAVRADCHSSYRYDNASYQSISESHIPDTEQNRMKWACRHILTCQRGFMSSGLTGLQFISFYQEKSVFHVISLPIFVFILEHTFFL